MSIILSLWTLLVLIIFLAIVIWAYSGRNRQAFDAAARIPFEETREEEERDNG